METVHLLLVIIGAVLMLASFVVGCMFGWLLKGEEVRKKRGKGG